MSREEFLSVHLGKFSWNNIPYASGYDTGIIVSARNGPPTLETADCSTHDVTVEPNSLSIGYTEIDLDSYQSDSCHEHVCVVASKFAGIPPKSNLVREDKTKLNWLHYRNYRQSPFLPTPDNLKSVIKKWRSHLKSPKKTTPEGSEPIKYCSVCSMSIQNPEHRESAEHRENLDFTEFDALKAEMESIL